MISPASATNPPIERPPLDVAVVIVTWNVARLIVNALQSLYDDLATSGLRYSVYVVDSASSDETPQRVASHFPQAHLIASADNIGFGRANNLAMRQMGFGGPTPEDQLPRAVYLLNPDTITHRGATRALYDALYAHPRAGWVGAQLAYEDGRFQHGAFAFPGLRQLWAEFFPIPGRWVEGRFNGRYPRAWYARGRPFRVDFTLGATMMLRREVIQQTGLFDEAFFMYCEEIDWAWRVHQAGWQVLCVPQARVTHLVGQSSGQVRSASLRHLWTSRLLLFDKHYPPWKRRLARALVALGMRYKMRQARANPDLSDSQRAELLSVYHTIAQQAGG